MEPMKVIRLNKKAYQIKGNAPQFLNGLTSNSLDKPMNAFLNIHGRIIATFDQLQLPDGSILIVVASQAADQLLQETSRFAKLSKSTLELLNAHVYFDLDNQWALEKGEYVIPQHQGRLIISPRDIKDTISEEEFNQFRLDHIIPLHTVDYQSGDMILNVHEHNYVSYTKGCFLGQEPVAKVHHRSKPTWKLVVRYADECTPEEQAKMTSQVKDAVTGRIRGFVFVKNIE